MKSLEEVENKMNEKRELRNNQVCICKNSTITCIMQTRDL